ncbi:fasciclin domain-containing protein [Leptolyngbya sp. FACHB-541]|uniref:fasciclin domain-containing protein n=1 Tax=Leptolyngbya sp. FACHB-541 TaxID=2692810 RepID=UPI001683556A|nr:fasciclin domain-containing protein [Leptolyngbya sp. FACHB-541]MBD1999503.1 fasciclin domain-containing protein [Leptolyngbya sp. FACHB-541]
MSTWVSVKKILGFAGISAASVLVALPALAQTANPRPSIFNEAPYNQTGATPTAPADLSQPAPTEMEAPAGMETEAPAGMETPAEPTAAAEAGTIVDVATANGSFGTLIAALTAAELDQVLQGEGPFTVFAPTDEAFAALPEGTVEQLLLPENRDLLVQILSYHVVPGELTSSELTSGEVQTVANEPVTVEVSADGVTVNEVTVVQPDVTASNGVIHVVDQVILPPSL